MADVPLIGLPHRRPTVVFAIPSTNVWDADFGMSFARLTAQSMPYVMEGFASLKSYDPVLARNSMVMGCMEMEPEIEWIIQFDADMVFPPDTLLRLLKAEKPVVAGLYLRRVPPHNLLGVAKDGKPFGNRTGLLEMARLPTGCLLTHRSVFEKIPYPWFRSVLMLTDDGKPQMTETHGPLVITEDFWFSDRCVEHGIEQWADLDLSRQLGHKGDRIFVWDPKAEEMTDGPATV